MVIYVASIGLNIYVYIIFFMNLRYIFYRKSIAGSKSAVIYIHLGGKTTSNHRKLRKNVIFDMGNFAKGGLMMKWGGGDKAEISN